MDNLIRLIHSQHNERLINQYTQAIRLWFDGAVTTEWCAGGLNQTQGICLYKPVAPRLLEDDAMPASDQHGGYAITRHPVALCLHKAMRLVAKQKADLTDEQYQEFVAELSHIPK